mgnify:CR=1 FL=1
MPTFEDVVRESYAAAEAKNLDLDKFVSLFAEDGYFLDMASGLKLTGAEVRQPMEELGKPFPDFHRSWRRCPARHGQEVRRSVL